MKALRGGLLLAVQLGLSAHASDIFSPGELSRAHQALEGISQCTECHGQGGSALSPQACLSCHRELSPQLAKGEGLHGRMPAEQRNACETCHHEHQGRGFPLIDWGGPDPKRFDHRRTGWPLKGKHLQVRCETCHDPRRVESADIVELLRKQPERKTWLGLGTQCESCHFDEHRGQLQGQACKSCHHEQSWKPAPGFNHDKTDFPLRGKHRPLECTQCHEPQEDAEHADAFPRPRASSFLKLAPIAHTCVNCHDDPHEGRLGQRCVSCHSPAGWRVMSGAPKERAFHAKTRFPLEGAHSTVDCKACHGPFPGKRAVFKGLPFQKCSDCHADAHVGQMKAARSAPAPDCGTCHTVDGFQPTTFLQSRHADTRYPLEGAHRAVGCMACHQPTPQLVRRVPASVRRELRQRKRPLLLSTALFDFRKPLDACETCHRDAHAGQFRRWSGGCASCHRLDAFTHVELNHDTQTRFPLVGKHRDTACSKCHPPTGSRGLVRYRPLEMACASCHSDPHAGQFADAGTQTTACEKCHTPSSFTKTRFEHRPPFTQYVLDGQHLQVPCEGCHPKVQVAGGTSPVQRFKPLPTACEECHVDHHQGVFRGFEP